MGSQPPLPGLSNVIKRIPCSLAISSYIAVQNRLPEAPGMKITGIPARSPPSEKDTCFPESRFIIIENLGRTIGSVVGILKNFEFENFHVQAFQMSMMMDSSFKSYDEILDSIKKKVHESLSQKDGIENAAENEDSDLSETHDDLEWEFTVFTILIFRKMLMHL
jgi:hypothetical protein